MFAGFVALAATLRDYIQLVDPSTGAPVNPDAAPTVSVYGPSGLLSGAGVTAAAAHTGSLTGATNASPISVTATAHGFATGAKVTISGVLGNVNANGTFTITVVDANTFTLNGSTGSGSYTSGGTYKATGFYQADLAATGGNGFAAGYGYTAYWSWAVSSVQQSSIHTFGVA